MSRWWVRLVAAGCLAAASGARAEPVKVAIGLSDWAGFAPLVLARDAGIFARHGLAVTITNLPQDERGAALARGQVQCAATGAESWFLWNAAGADAKQIFAIDKSMGADGIATRPTVASIRDLKGRTVASTGPGTASFFFLAWILTKSGVPFTDVKRVDLGAREAADALLAGRVDAAVTYEPYLSGLREHADAAKVAVTTLDEPVVSDTFGCRSAFLESSPQAAKALADSFFDVLELIAADPVTSYDRMGAYGKLTGTQFGDIAQTLKWQDRYGNVLFFETDYPAFAKDAATLLLQLGLLKRVPDLTEGVDARFIRQP